MAVDVYSETSSLVVSPRISFSHDLKDVDIVPVECHHRRSDALLLESTIDFDFCISHSFFSQELSSAEELFANGKILPVEVKRAPLPCKDIHQSEPIPAPDPEQKNSETLSTTLHTNRKSENADHDDVKKKRLKELLSSELDPEEEKPPTATRPFWQFRRSSSLNCESGTGRSNGLIRSLQFLSRSNSTGSAPNPKPTAQPKVIQKQHSLKEKPVTRRNSSASSSSTQYYTFSSSKPPPLKKNCRSYGSGVQISPVLNIPPACISKGTVQNLFGFGSLFCNSKSKRKKKKK